MGEPSDMDSKASSQWVRGRTFMGVGGGEGGRGAWMLRGACSRGQEVLEPSVDLDATSTALPVDSRWSVLLGLPNSQHPRGHSTSGPAPRVEGPLGPPHPEVRVRGSGLRDML